jgi:hypothetical protein
MANKNVQKDKQRSTKHTKTIFEKESKSQKPLFIVFFSEIAESIVTQFYMNAILDDF